METIEGEKDQVKKTSTKVDNEDECSKSDVAPHEVNQNQGNLEEEAKDTE